MRKGNLKYFNFPVQLLSGFLINTHTCLDSVLCYCIFWYSIREECSCEEAAVYFNISLGSAKRVEDKGRELFSSIDARSPKVGIELRNFWDYFEKDHKSEFDKVVLLAFLALKSILQNKPYCKITNDFLLARMDGRSHSCAINGLSPEIKKYAKRYHLDKIKTELKLHWYLTSYGFHTRGFYVSFKIPYEQLVCIAESRRLSLKVKELKEFEKAARARAISRIKSLKDN